MSDFVVPEHVIETCRLEGISVEDYYLHELACNIAEDLDNGAIFAWRLTQVKEHLAAGGTTDVIHGELVLVGGKED